MEVYHLKPSTKSNKKWQVQLPNGKILTTVNVISFG